MRSKSTVSAIVCAAILSLTSACGGGDGQVANAPPPPPTGGIGQLGIATGPISTFSSVVVNGVAYNTDNATFTIDGQPATQGDLKVGQVVTVKGEFDSSQGTGTAETVAFDDLVKGPISSIDAALSQIVVLGQTVQISPDTSFDDNISPASFDGLAVGMLVEVSGQIAADGSIQATRLEAKPAGTPFEVHGTVSNLDATNMQFTLNALTVDYSNAMLDNFGGGQIAEGDFVEAKDEGVTPALGAAGELLATKVELENLAITGDSGTHVEVEGFITRFVSAQDFDVSGTPVITNGSTVFENGVAADLGLNIKVEVEGELDANNVLVAEKVSIRRAKIVRVEALADSVDAAANAVVVLGVTFNVDSLTRLEDKTSADVSPLTLADINASDYLRIRGSEFPAGSGQILAALLERRDVDADSVLQGFVETVADPSLTILGVTIETGGGTVFRDVDDSVLTAAEFFGMVSAGSLVKAKGVESSATTITATEVEFEQEF